MPIVSNIKIKYKITDINIDLKKVTIGMHYISGYNNGTAFITLAEEEVILNQTDTVALFNALGDSTAPLYQSMKVALYQYLIDKGFVSGNIVNEVLEVPPIDVLPPIV